MSESLLEAHAVSVGYRPAGSWGSRTATRLVVNEVSLAIEGGESFGVIGESGSGKTTLARALVGLTPLTAGEVRFGAHSVLRPRGAPTGEYRRAVQYVFQDPNASLNPRRPIWWLVSEAARLLGVIPEEARRELAGTLLGQVSLPSSCLDRFPHQLSGGQRQRVALARALGAEPQLLVLDEPTSALDVSVQAEILNLLLEIQRQRRLTMLLISHDLAVVRHMCDRVAVMTEGRIVETGTAAEVFGTPRAPYTRTLVAAAMPRRHVALAPESTRIFG